MFKGGGIIMLQGFFFFEKSFGALQKIDGIMKKKDYPEILKHCLKDVRQINKLGLPAGQ